MLSYNYNHFLDRNSQIKLCRGIRFIYRKWGVKEVENFIELTEEFLQILWSGFIEGKPTEKSNVKLFVISKQTTLVYKLNKT